MSERIENRITTIAMALKKERLNKKYTQNRVASILGVDKTTISAWERGVRFPRENNFPLIAEFLGISDRQLFSMSKSRGMAG